MTRILTWNIGSFVFLKFGKYIGLPNKDHLEYFQPKLNAEFISKTIENLDPDFLFLQEFWDPLDADKIEHLKKYPYRKFLNMWYRNDGALIASKTPFSIEEKDGLFIVSYNQLRLIPIHFYAFSAKERLYNLSSLSQLLDTTTLRTLAFGDTNIWSRGQRFIFSDDKKVYRKITNYLTDISKNLLGTNYFGFGLDKVFTSNDLEIKNVQSPRSRGEYMDHYPIFFTVE